MLNHGSGGSGGGGGLQPDSAQLRPSLRRWKSGGCASGGIGGGGGPPLQPDVVANDIAVTQRLCAAAPATAAGARRKLSISTRLAHA